jgi:N-acetylneuraminic acid mutarotase
VGGRFYLIGPTRLDIYDPRPDKWSTGQPMSHPRVSAASAVLGGRIYVVGGAEPGNPKRVLATGEVYDPAADQWRTLPDMRTPRKGLGAAEMGGVLYAIGGVDGAGHALSTVEVLNTNGQWETFKNMRVAVSGAFVAAREGRLYVAGGKTTAGAIATLQSCTVQSGIWTTLEDMPEVRFDGCGAEWINGELYVIGGKTREPPVPHDDLFVYDPRRRFWHR